MKNTMNIFCITLATALTFGNCNNGASGTGNTPSADTTNVVAFANGVTDVNRGTHKGPVELKGTLNAFKTGKVYLWETQGKTFTKIDSTTIQNGAFSFGKKEYEVGVYMLGTNDNNMCSIILNPAEPVCELTFSGGRMDAGMTAPNSKENEGWSKYTMQEPILLKAIKDAKVAGAKNSGMKAQYDQQAAAKEKELVKLQAEMIAQYPNTQFAKLLTWKQEPNKTDIAKYWDNIDFSDESIIRSKVLTDRIESFMRSFSKGEESGFINCVATVAEKAKANDRVLEFALNQMLTGFMKATWKRFACTSLTIT